MDNEQIPPYSPFGPSGNLIKAQTRGITARNAVAGLPNTEQLIFVCEAHGHANTGPLHRPNAGFAQSDQSGGDALGLLSRNRTNQVR